MLKRIDLWKVIGPAVVAAGLLSACTAGATAPAVTVPEAVRPSNPGGAGPAIKLTGDAKAGQVVFTTNCVRCHGDQGHGGVSNPGSTDGTVPALNPIDATLINGDLAVYATNLDLFIEHGSTPAGDKPTLTMPLWGDQKLLANQQIADVIAYLISLNKP